MAKSSKLRRGVEHARGLPPDPVVAHAELPPTATKLASKAKDLEALREAVVDAAGVSAGLWLSYLFVLFYLLIAVGGITHRDLFLENPVKLPFLNVDLPLIGFFVLGPALLLVVHAYVLLHFVLLAGKVGVFHAELQNQISAEDVRTPCASAVGVDIAGLEGRAGGRSASCPSARVTRSAFPRPESYQAASASL
jgi:hypothetical protein